MLLGEVAQNCSSGGSGRLRIPNLSRTLILSFEAAGQLLQTEERAGLIFLRPQAWRQVLAHQRDFCPPPTRAVEFVDLARHLCWKKPVDAAPGRRWNLLI